MLWSIKQLEGHNVYWKERNASEGIGASGEWVSGRKNATRYTDERRLAYIAEKGELPVNFKWECVSERFKNALDIQSAVNPAGISLALHEAFCEVRADGGDTSAQKNDPACRLILHQLSYLLGMPGGYDLTDYGKYYADCEKAVAQQKDSK
jgi:hypothetical protein